MQGTYKIVQIIELPKILIFKLICVLLFVLNCLFTIHLSAQNKYELNAELNKAYIEIQSLHLINAQRILDNYKKSSKDPNIHFIENYIDFYTLFIGEDENEYEMRSQNKSNRINLIEDKNELSPYNRYGRAVILVQWSLINIKFESYFTAFIDISNAYKLLKKNEVLYPDFKANKMILGVIHALIGTIPDNYLWAVNLMGFEGTIKQGNDELKSIIEGKEMTNFLFAQEAIVLYTMINLHLANDHQKACNILDNYRFNDIDGPLASYVNANVSMRTYKNDLALSALSSHIRDTLSYEFHHLTLMKGIALMRKLDPSCKSELISYVNNFKGKSYIKEAYLYLAWQDIIFNDGLEYKMWLELCRTEGALQTDEDKAAFWESRIGIMPHKKLLESRVLFDGGYWTNAKNVLVHEIKLENLNSDQKIEYYYRLARIEEKTKNPYFAINAFNKVIKMNDDDNYLSCSSFLHLGLIHENNKEYESAIRSYTSCLKLNPNQYKTGLHQKAKAGLNRIKQL